jgi:hypothetical protein
MSISVSRRALGHAFCMECESDVLQGARCLYCETELSGEPAKVGRATACPWTLVSFLIGCFWRLAPPQMRTLNDASAAENPREASASAGTALPPFSAIRKQSAPLCAVSSLDLCPLLNPCRITGTSRARSWLLPLGSAPTSSTLRFLRTRSSNTCAHLDVTPHAAPRVHSSVMRQLRLP